MSCIAVSDNYLAVSKGLYIDCYDKNKSTHAFFNVLSVSSTEDDCITNLIISSDSKYLAAITSSTKRLIIYDLLLSKDIKTDIVPRSASKIRFTTNNSQILVADKSGDVLLYDIGSEESGTKLIGHLSLLLDVLQTNDGKHIITSDRDEKIRVSRFPNTYNIETFCLGHKEFVNQLEMLPHNSKYLISSSGDGTVKCWNYANGHLAYSLNAYLDVDDVQLKDNFTKIMDEEGVEVTTLPIVHLSTTLLDDKASLLAVAIHSFNKLLIYRLESENDKFSHKKEETLALDKFPSAFTFHRLSLLLYDEEEMTIIVMNVINKNDKISLECHNKIKMFDSKPVNFMTKSNLDTIRVLYKRKFDNVQEYQERKRQRLERTAQ